MHKQDKERKGIFLFMKLEMGSWAPPGACVSLQDVCEEAVERRKSSVQWGETDGCAVMARLENKNIISVALFPVKNPPKSLQKPLINHCTSDEDRLIDGDGWMKLTCLSRPINYCKCSSKQTATFSVQINNWRHCSPNYSASQSCKRKADRAADGKMPVYLSFWETWSQGVALHQPVISEVQHQHPNSLWRKHSTEFRSVRDGSVSGDTQQRRL